MKTTHHSLFPVLDSGFSSCTLGWFTGDLAEPWQHSPSGSYLQNKALESIFYNLTRKPKGEFKREMSQPE